MGDAATAATVGSFISQVGFPVAVVCFFLWRDWQRERQSVERDRQTNTREERMAARITVLEKTISDDLTTMLSNSIKLIERNTVVMERLERFLESRTHPDGRPG